MLRLVLFVVLAIVIGRALWRLLEGVIEGASRAGSSAQVPDRGVQMVRDPVCGTFVLPERAVTLVHGRQRLYFCSDTCRDRHRGEHQRF